MTDEDAFLEAVRTQPDDDTPRLVYADWLEERSDPRAELIRLETSMNRLPVYSEEYHRLKPERSRLRQQAPADWLDTMGYRPVYRPMFTKLPPTTAERWRLATEFIEIWHERPVEPGDGYTEEEIEAAEARLGRPLPRALREWYAFAGRRRDVWSVQDRLRAPSELSLNDNGSLIVRLENQNCTRWYIRAQDLNQDDPPIYGGDSDREISATSSAFALLVLVYEAKWRPSAGAFEGRPDPEQQQFELELSQFPGIVQTNLPSWYWFDDPKLFWEAENIIFERDPQGWFWITARTAVAREQVDRHFTSILVWYD